jgi:hypothetical protein
MKWSAKFFVGLVFGSLFLVNICFGIPQGARGDLDAAEEGPPALPARILPAPTSPAPADTTPPTINTGDGQTGEFIFGVSSGLIQIVYVDAQGQTARSAILQNAPLIDMAPYWGFQVWDMNRMYGASDSDSNDYFWATNHYPYSPYHPISSLQKIFPAESAVYKIGSGYIQNPGDPNIRELGYDEDADILYGTNYGKLYSIDTSLGTVGYIGDFGSGFDGQPIDQAWSMDYDPNIGELVIIDQVFDESRVYHPAQMYYTDRSSGAAGYVGDTAQQRLTDIYYSSLHHNVYACANYPNRFYQVNTTTGALTEINQIGHNILGLGGGFAESEGVSLGLTTTYNKVNVSAYSELEIDRDEDSDSDGGISPTASATAFVQETGSAPGVGQTSLLEANAGHEVVSGHVLLDCQANFTTTYDGVQLRGQGGGQAQISQMGRLTIGTNETYPSGSRGLLLIADGTRLLSENVSQYVTDWRLRVYDPDNSDRNIIYITEEDVPQILDVDALFMGAAYVIAGETLYYDLQVEVDIQHLQADLNSDGIVNIDDYNILSLWWLYDQCGPINLNCDHADMEPDGDVDFQDIDPFMNEWLMGKKVDADVKSLTLDFGFEFRTVEAPTYSGTRPLNDECEHAIPIVADHRYLGTTNGATESLGGDISSCGYNDLKDVWYQFEPTETGLYSILVRGWGVSPYISIFDDCEGTQIPGMCWPQYSEALIEVSSLPQTYLIRIAGYNNSTGNFDLTVNHYAQPDNDDCAGAVEIQEDSFYTFHNYGATESASSNCGDGDTRDVWYSYTPSQDCATVFRLYNDDYKEMTLVLYDACGGSELVCAATQSCDFEDYTALIADVTGGQTYYLRVAFNYGERGKFYLDVQTFSTPPANDECSHAKEIESFEFYWDETTYGATGATSSSCGDDDTRDVWYQYTASDDEFVSIKVYYFECGPQLTLSLYNAPCGGGEQDCVLSQTGGEGDVAAELTFSATMGQTYYVRVAFNDNWMGDFELEVQTYEPPYNDECSEAIEIEGLDNWDEGFNYGATDSGVNYQCWDDTRDVWYYYTATADDDGKELYFYVENLDWDSEAVPTIALFSSCSDSDPFMYDCGSCYMASEVAYTVTEGETIYIRIAFEEENMSNFVVFVSEWGNCIF